ncbi:MAG: glycerol-3-phosphate dehydrogenase/oxidase [Chitinophagaceae bacterium]
MMNAAAVFDRDRFIALLTERKQWDMIIIGGGATGLGIALDSASRGYTTLLLEQSDFAKGTSSRSTKLVHGGVRYLAQGNLKMVYTALRERGILFRNAAHLVTKQLFIIPCYSWFAVAKYLVGLKIYDWLAKRFSFGTSTFMNAAAVKQQLPLLKTSSLVGGVAYFDGQFDDARLALNIAQTGAEKGAVLLNYFKVTSLIKEGSFVSGLIAVDEETQLAYKLHGKVVINATGVFVDDILQMDMPGSKPLVQPSQGVHLVVNHSFLNSAHAIMIPDTDDGRVLFALPWNGHVLLGTTDTALNKHSLEPRALETEISFILNTVKKYLDNAPHRGDVLSVFAGLRPLAAPQDNAINTKEISRDHKLIIAASGLITITGGKWTTYRKMAEETIDVAIRNGSLPRALCTTENIPIHGCVSSSSINRLSVYGSDQHHLAALIAQDPALGTPLAAGLPYTEVEVVWAVRHEMARTVEDVLARRLRLLFLNAEAALSIAPRVARIMAAELERDEKWEQEQVAGFTLLAKGYQIKNIDDAVDIRLNALVIH